MKAEQSKKVEIMMNRKRYEVSAAAAKIAIETMGATEVVPFEKPKELKVKPPIIQPEYKKIVVPEAKPEAIKIQESLKVEPTAKIPEPVKPKQTRKAKK